jgi:hypothetical protein
MSGWLDLAQLGLAPSQKHQALLGAPKIVQCGERFYPNNQEEAADDGGLKCCDVVLDESLRRFDSL